ncbi:DUF2238 domain-containing protein [Dokdonella sp.]|uniref:DUF2238 domain-containing protein n=1 Tax=Dokdonella sp. TaxID=2291710 RepID=UPI003C435B69
MLSGTCTHARVTPGFELQECLSMQRHPCEKTRHLTQGFEPALAATEFLMHGGRLVARKMYVFEVICIVLAISASDELIAWGAALVIGADEFRGTQANGLDTESDMFCALVGALAAVTFFSRLHDRQLHRLAATGAS